LINGFRNEFNKWETNKDYDNYRNEWNKLGSKVANLAAGAYLHISYDLPRVIANESRFEPERISNKLEPAPEEACAEEIYLAVTPIFEEVFRDAASKLAINGTLLLCMLLKIWE
jgi:hypothetical protein